jgi:4-amino-4-deoxy-L-arabinose transferase-like glycosyltransferase
MKKLFFFVLLGLVLRLALNIHTGFELSKTSDDAQYFRIANNVISQGRYSDDGVRLTANRTPLFPLIAAVSIKLFGQTTVPLRLLLIFADLSIAVLMYLLALRFFSEKVASIAAFFYLVNPLALYYTTSLNIDILLTALLLMMFHFIFQKKYFFAALFLGFAALLKPIALYVVILLIIAMMIDRLDWRRQLLVVLVWLSVLLPWGAYQWLAFHHLGLGDTSVGVVLWGAHNEVVLKSPRTMGTWEFSSRLSEYAHSLGFTDEYARDRYCVQQALKHIPRNPLVLANLELHKLLAFWNFWPMISERTDWTLGVIGFLSFGWLLPFFFYGFWKYAGDRRMVLFWIYGAYFQAITLVTYGSIRLRMPITPLIIIIAFAGIELLWRKYAERK